MATNLRLDDETVAALRATAQSTGRSQQDLIREAIDRYLGRTGASDRDRAVASGLVKAPARFVDVRPSINLPDDVSILDLLERDDRR